MSGERVEIVRRIYAAVGSGDAATVADLYDPEVEWDFTRSPLREVLNRNVYRGLDGMREFTRERFQAWRDFRDRCEELIDAGEAVVSVVASGGHGRASGAKGELVHFGVWAFRHGRVHRVTWFGEREDALAAAGDA